MLSKLKGFVLVHQHKNNASTQVYLISGRKSSRWFTVTGKTLPGTLTIGLLPGMKNNELCQAQIHTLRHMYCKYPDICIQIPIHTQSKKSQSKDYCDSVLCIVQDTWIWAGRWTVYVGLKWSSAMTRVLLEQLGIYFPRSSNHILQLGRLQLAFCSRKHITEQLAQNFTLVP